MAKIIRIGIVGAGKNTIEKHIPNLQSITDVEIVRVCNRSDESSRKVAEQFGIPEISSNWVNLVNSPDIDAVVIGTWPNMHCPITMSAIEANKHVMCEARLAMNAAEAHEMLKAALKKPELITQVVPAPFSFHIDATLKRLIDEGYLGDILAAEVLSKSGFVDKVSAINWRQNIETSGLNIMLMGIWYETLMRWIGPAKSVMAMGKTVVRQRKDLNTGKMKAIKIPDHLDIIAEMECGAQAHFGISDVTGMRNAFEATLFGSEGTLQFRENKLFGGKVGDANLKEIDIPSEEVGSWRVEEEFINAIRGNEMIKLTTFEDGVRYMKFTEAVNRSMDEGRKEYIVNKLLPSD
jgi:predicted dehydrogenase